MRYRSIIESNLEQGNTSKADYYVAFVLFVVNLGLIVAALLFADGL